MEWAHKNKLTMREIKSAGSSGVPDLRWLFEKKFIIRSVVVATAVFFLVYVATLPVFIKPLYESETIIYVPLTLISQQHQQQGIGFGGNAEIDWHIQVLKSTRMLDSLNLLFGFSGQWGKDMNLPDARSKLYQAISSRINIGKTRYGSVSVKVRHTDPSMAAEISGKIVSIGDAIREDILHDNRYSAFDLARERYRQKEEEVAEMQRIIEQEEGRRRDVSPIPGTNIHEILVVYEDELRELRTLRNDYKRKKNSLNTPLPSSYIVSEAVVAHQPVWPPRKLLSLASALVVLLGLVFFEVIRLDKQTGSSDA